MPVEGHLLAVLVAGARPFRARPGARRLLAVPVEPAAATAVRVVPPTSVHADRPSPAARQLPCSGVRDTELMGASGDAAARDTPDSVRERRSPAGPGPSSAAGTANDAARTANGAVGAAEDAVASGTARLPAAPGPTSPPLAPAAPRPATRTSVARTAATPTLPAPPPDPPPTPTPGVPMPLAPPPTTSTPATSTPPASTAAVPKPAAPPLSASGSSAVTSAVIDVPPVPRESARRAERDTQVGPESGPRATSGTPHPAPGRRSAAGPGPLPVAGAAHDTTAGGPAVVTVPQARPTGPLAPPDLPPAPPAATDPIPGPTALPRPTPDAGGGSSRTGAAPSAPDVLGRPRPATPRSGVADDLLAPDRTAPSTARPRGDRPTSRDAEQCRSTGWPPGPAETRVPPPDISATPWPSAPPAAPTPAAPPAPPAAPAPPATTPPPWRRRPSPPSALFWQRRHLSRLRARLLR